MSLLATERRFWPCEEHTAKPNIGVWTPIPAIPYYQHLLFFVARGVLFPIHFSQPRQIVGSMQETIQNPGGNQKPSVFPTLPHARIYPICWLKHLHATYGLDSESTSLAHGGAVLANGRSGGGNRDVGVFRRTLDSRTQGEGV